MKRDNDFIRQMLMDVEASEDAYYHIPSHIGMSPEETKTEYHAELLCDAGFLHSVNDGVYRMTNQGHDYLEAIRDDTVWSKTKAGVTELGGATLGIMRELAIAYLKQKAKIKLGIDLG